MPCQRCFPPTELFGKFVGGSFYTTSSHGASLYWAGAKAGPVTEFFTESGLEAKSSFLTSDHSSAVPFVGVITSSAEAIVDTAAQEGLIGRPALLRLFEALRKFGLKGRWTGEASEARRHRWCSEDAGSRGSSRGHRSGSGSCGVNGGGRGRSFPSSGESFTRSQGKR